MTLAPPMSAASELEDAIRERRSESTWPASRCVVCSRRFDDQPVPEGAPTLLASCKDCGHLQLPFVPPQDAVTALFATPYWGSAQPPSVTGDPLARAASDRDTAAVRLERDLLPFLSTRLLVDLRAGTGGLVRAARDLGIYSDGCEPVAELRALARRAHAIELSGDGPDCLEIPPSGLGAVAAYDLVDFVVDPTPTFELARGLLRRGTLLVVGFRGDLDLDGVAPPTYRSDDACAYAHRYRGDELVTILGRFGFTAIDLHSPDGREMVLVAEVTS
jgi:hypothetical protein